MARIVKIFFANLFILITLLLIIEVAIRVKGDTYTWTEKGQGIYVDPWERADDKTLHVRPPGKHQEYYPEFEYNIEVNEEGVRDKKRDKEKGNNIVRVLGLGDSFMEGMGADIDSTIMAFLEKQLSVIYPDGVFECLNGGVAGSDVFRSYNLLEERLIKYNPDYCIILFNNTDFNDWLIRGNEKGVFPPMTTPSKVERFLFHYSHLYRSFTINILKHSWLQQSPKEQKELWKYFLIDFKTVLKRYEDLLGGKDRIIFVVHPLIHEYEKGQYYLPFDDLKETMEVEGIKTLDVISCLEAEQLNSEHIYWNIDMHFNSLGYYQVANCLAKKGWIIPQN